MEALHFTPGSMAPARVRLHGTVAHLPLASGSGAFEVSCLYLAPGGTIAVPPQKHRQLLLFINGKGEARCPGEFGMFLEPSAGVGLLFAPGESCQLSSATGLIALMIEGEQLEADPCGISSPQRVMGQLWPMFESN